MLLINSGGHSAYQNTFVSAFLALFPNPFTVPKETWDLIVKFWYLDLSETDTIMMDYYPKSGKAAKRLPSCLLRSYLLSSLSDVHHNQRKETPPKNHLLIILPIVL